ncbi:unnamed protein product [Parnassius apollo]|uniref:(apollo) hypothetical protein n=1 Tax=Parnassius apollo TaxID=110799 RepID=A0A8S3Y2H2_PARAO|nr:unnamed protein product [Parnassius apollo]
MAIKAVNENRMGWLLASKHFNVPQATLRRYFYSVPVNLGRFKPTFNADMEKALVDHMLEFESRLFGFNTTEIRKLAFEFAERLGLDHRFDKTEKIAGWDWLKGFRERNPQISLRAPEPTSAARAKAFNKPQTQQNQDELNYSKPTDAEEQLLAYVETGNSQDHINFDTDATLREVETRHWSPTILSPNVVTHLLLRDTAASNKDAIPQEAKNIPLSLKQLSENVVMNLLQDQDVNFLPLQPMLLDFDPKNAKEEIEQMNVIAPKNSYQEQIDDDVAVPETLCENDIASSLDTNQIAEHLLLQPELISISNDFAKNSILKEISLLPKATSTGKLRVNRKVGGSQVFTSSPFMNEIKAAAQQKKENENRASLKKQKQTKRNIFNDSVESKPAVKNLKSIEVQRIRSLSFWTMTRISRKE